MGTPKGRNFPVLKILVGDYRTEEERVPGKMRLPPLTFFFLAPYCPLCPGVSLEYSNLCMPDLPHLLAFLSASRYRFPIKRAKGVPSLRHPIHTAAPSYLFSGMFCPEHCSCPLPL